MGFDREEILDSNGEGLPDAYEDHLAHVLEQEEDNVTEDDL